MRVMVTIGASRIGRGNAGAKPRPFYQTVLIKSSLAAVAEPELVRGAPPRLPEVTRTTRKSNGSGFA